MRLIASLVLSLLLGPACSVARELPAYVGQALERLNSDAPRGWAFTLTTKRGDHTSTERYDPSRPKGGEWTLLATNGREPNADELQRYLRYKASNAPAARATFERGDIDVGSLTLLEEKATRAVWRGRFRDSAGEPLLAHVMLDLTIDRSNARVEEAVLRLVEPFSPALGVLMRELELTMTFAPAGDGTLELPRTAHSRFRGRIFFLVPIEEELHVTYSDFTRVTPTRP